MTPLIREMVKYVPEPETAMWFDFGQLGYMEGARVAWDDVVHQPYWRTSCVAIGADGVKYAICLQVGQANSLEGQDSLLVFVAMLDKGKPSWGVPFVVLPVDGELKYYAKGEELDPAKVKSIMRLVLYFTLQMKKDGQAYQPVAQKTHINQKRKAKGKQPLYDWHTVTIEPPAPKAEYQGGHHASPRRHQARGHWRNCRSGKRVWVRECWKGDASKGAVFKDYRVAT